MKTVYHSADSRGHADHGWLNTYHTFSFAGYYDSSRMGFGALRVLNDDMVQGGMGFGRHPHKNMEIITIPLEGALKHEDNIGNSGIIQKGEIQVMSAGSGITHAEMNAHLDQNVHFLQIWIIPNQADVTPRYEQIDITEKTQKNNFQLIISPKIGEGIWIHQDAWFYLGNFESGVSKTYTLKNQGNGVYLFVIQGKVKVGDQQLNPRDGYGISETSSFTLETLTNAEILLIEVPMEN